MEEERGVDDRISGFPEGILHHILSFLPTEDVVRTATTCKTLNQVWTTLPYFDIGPEFVPPLPEKEEDDPESEKLFPFVVEAEEELCEIVRKREKLFTFMERTLTSRRMQDLTIQKFQLGLTKLDVQLREHLDRWVHYLVDCNIKELHLQISRAEAQLYDLPSVLFTAPSLCVLTLSRCRMPCVSITLASLRKLHLEWVYLEEPIFRDIINTCRHLEELDLSRCLGLKNRIHLSAQSHLKFVKLFPNSADLFDEVLVETPYLERFYCTGGRRPYKIDIAASWGSLKHLALTSANITNTRLFDLILKLTCLELLRLGNLNLKSLEISSSSLKQIVLSRVFDNYTERRFGNITIDTPNLIGFYYRGCLSSVFLKGLAVKLVNLSIDEVQRFRICTAEQLCNNLMPFLHTFDYSGVVKLKCAYLEILIFPVEMRLNLLAPLAHIEHLILEGRMKTPSINVISELLDSVLWICPNLCKLTLKDDKNMLGHAVDLFIKFTSELTANQCTCVTFPRRCWRHCISDVKGKLDGADAEVCRNIVNYLNHHGETS